MELKEFERTYNTIQRLRKNKDFVKLGKTLFEICMKVRKVLQQSLKKFGETAFFTNVNAVIDYVLGGLPIETQELLLNTQLKALSVDGKKLATKEGLMQEAKKIKAQIEAEKGVKEKLRCIGNICFDESRKGIRVELEECSPELLNKIKDALSKDTVVEWVVPAKAKSRVRVVKNAHSVA